MSRSHSPESWGRIPQASCQTVGRFWAEDPFPEYRGSILPFGLGRSYGDSCLNDGGTLCATSSMHLFRSFDPSTGIVCCDAGVTIEQLLQVFVPLGWFPAVTPGTKYVTVGGAIANDIHGKNHHVAGSFGCHVRRFEILRSDGDRLVCSAAEHAELFRATIGGLGLTGLVTWAEIQLSPIRSSSMAMESTRFGNVREFFEINRDRESRWPYTVAWIDCLSSGSSLGRGIYMAGRHAEDGPLVTHRASRLTVPCDLPALTLNPLSVRAFNELYFRRVPAAGKIAQVHYDRFFYPLDAVNHWNRIYGRRGFFQYQSVVPPAGGEEAIREMLRVVARSQQASFLSILKTFGGIPSPGLLSFPRPGFTLALDFPNSGTRTLELLNSLDLIVRAAGGILYPAKDARMSASDFQCFYPEWTRLQKSIDPAFSSSFWRRVSPEKSQ